MRSRLVTSRIRSLRLWGASLASGLLLAACGGGGDAGGGGGGGGGSFQIGGSVSGLATGASVVLLNNGGNATTVSANGSFTFSTGVGSGAAYAVSVGTQPTTPSQTCTVTNGSGSATANVTGVTVNCTTNTFTLGGSVSGLAGGASVVLANGGATVTVSASGSFTFPTAIASGTAYSVTVGTQPGGQVCSVQNGGGTIGGAAVTNVAVTCSSTSYTVSGVITGLSGSGLVLQNNGGNNLTLAAGATTFSFPAIANSSPYAVTVASQPLGPAQTCVLIANGSGTGGSNVSNVVVSCSTNTYPIGVNVSGLAGTGLVLRNNGGNNVAITANGTASFGTLVSGAAYNITVFSQPTAPAQNCAANPVGSGAGTVGNGPVTVNITCTTLTGSIGGTVSGLAGTGLLLRNNGGDTLAVNVSGSFTFPTLLANGASYAVTVFQQPQVPPQTCTVSNGSGTLGVGNVTNVAITCVSDRYTVGGTVSGLGSAGGSLVLQNNAGDNLTVSANGSFTFSTAIQVGSAYAVTALSNPANRSCAVSSGSGTMGAANLTSVVVRCRSKHAFFANESGTPSVSSFTVGATGGFTLAGTVPVQNNSFVGAHAKGVAVTPSAGHVIVAVDRDYGSSLDGELHVYALNSSTGAMTFASKVTVASFPYCGGVPNSGSASCGINDSAPFAVTTAPEMVVVHPNGQFVYLQDGVGRGSCYTSNVPCDRPRKGIASSSRTTSMRAAPRCHWSTPRCPATTWKASSRWRWIRRAGSCGAPATWTRKSTSSASTRPRVR